MKHSGWECMAADQSQNVNFIAHQRDEIMRREVDNAGGRPSLDLDWIDRPYQLQSGDVITHTAQEIGNQIGVDAEKVFRILLCAIDVAQHWQKDHYNRFRALDVSFDVSRLLGTGFNTVYEVLREADVLWR